MINRARFKRSFKAMSNKAQEMGFKNIREADKAGKEVELKEAFEKEKQKS